MKKLIILIFTFIGLTINAQITKTVTGNHDGDNLKFKGENKQYRLLGVDAPEVYSPFVNKTQPMGVEASNYLRTLLKGKDVFVTEHSKVDVYGRKLITVVYDGKDVAETLIANGMAHYFYSPKLKKEQRQRYQQAELSAKFERIGIWGQKDSTGNYIIPVLPSIWRKNHKV